MNFDILEPSEETKKSILSILKREIRRSTDKYSKEIQSLTSETYKLRDEITSLKSQVIRLKETHPGFKRDHKPEFDINAARKSINEDLEYRPPGGWHCSGVRICDADWSFYSKYAATQDYQHLGAHLARYAALLQRCDREFHQFLSEQQKLEQWATELQVREQRLLALKRDYSNQSQSATIRRYPKAEVPA